jgi:uncharacterized membrane protein YjgN (DUF898 family)
MDAHVAPPPLPAIGEGAAPTAPVFGARAGLLRLLLKNAALTVITLAFYRFWARTSLRRWFWGNVRIAGEPLEYTGTGGELFIGFLIVIAVLTPVGLVYSAVQEFALANRGATIAANIVYGVALTLLTHAALFRARRYRLSRTRWRGIRCAQLGHTGRYVALAAMWNVILIATAGLAYPWLRVALQRYKMRNTWFGNQAFSFAGSGARLILPWLLVYALVIAPIAGWLGLNWGPFMILGTIPDNDPPARAVMQADFWQASGSYWLFALALVGGVFGWIAYRLAELRHFSASTRFGAAAFSSSAKTSVVVLIALGFALALAAWLAAIWMGISLMEPILHQLYVLYVPEGTRLGLGIYLMIVAGVVAILALAYLGWHLLSYLWLRVQIMRHVCATLTISNLASVEAVLQSQALHQKFGEGLADGFDVSGV